MAWQAGVLSLSQLFDDAPYTTSMRPHEFFDPTTSESGAVFSTLESRMSIRVFDGQLFSNGCCIECRIR